MASLYAQYIAEREGKQIVETEHSFATYRIVGEECYIIDIFVEKGLRKGHIASELADQIAEIAKAQGCTYLSGSVSPNAAGATESLKVLLAYGFQLVKADPQLIWFIKPLGVK